MYKFIYKILLFLDSFGIFIKIPSVEQKVQIIFNRVINTSIYGKNSNVYMCIALADSPNSLITDKEYLFAKNEIRRYLRQNSFQTNFLSTKLMELNRPAKFEDRLRIYQNWSSRPFKKVQ